MENIKHGKVLAIGYNTIYIKEEDGNVRNIYFNGLQKRVLKDVEEETLKRLKRIDFIGDEEEFWNVGINFIVCCDLCDNGLYHLFNTEFLEEFDDKHRCSNCHRQVCSECWDFENRTCKKCLRKELILKLRT